jgi:hypothetical protein
MAKTRLVPITDPAELTALRAGAGGLDCPALYEPPAGQADQTVYADADELRAWRAGQLGDGGSQNTSEGSQR